MRAGLAVVLLWALAATVTQAQNLLVNADFDEGVNEWQSATAVEPNWQAEDEGGCFASGSALLASEETSGGLQAAVLGQCVPAAGAAAVGASTSYRGGGIINQVGVTFHQSEDCSDENPPFASSPPLPASPAAWARLEMSVTDVPAGTQSMRLAAGGALGLAFFIEVDRVYLGAPARIFAADFETDEPGTLQPCRWTSTQP
jgi:hypothetical protein